MGKKKKKAVEPESKPELEPLPHPPIPRAVDGVFRVFPANVIGTYLPLLENIPEEFKSHGNKWCSFVDDMFFRGIAQDTAMHSKPGIDPKVAFAHVDVCLRSYEPKHEHKTAGVAYLLYCFFAKIVVPSRNIELVS